ncbi:MAG: endonuclease MutS2 [Dehalococcoidales bacterium]|nr:MAG: endonuclease MutS2 [Dehalococcoidales bacterium]
MDNKSLEMLEFHRIKEIIAGFASFPASQQLALNLTCSTDYKWISRLSRQSAEARELLSQEGDFFVGEVIDSREEVRMAARGRVFEPMVLVSIGRTMASARNLHSRLSRMSAEFPLIWEIAQGITPLRQLENDIARCLTQDGELLDSASPQLATIRKQLRTTRQQLLKHLEAIIKSARGQRIIQEPIITEREGRYVIPIRVESRKEIRGIVHDVSNTGATVFIEPWTTTETGNKLRELVVEEQREIERILQDLSVKVGTHEEEVCSNIALSAEIDLVLAKARYARQAKAIEATPVTFDGNVRPQGDKDTVLRLVEARHPLLGDKAVPLSVEIGPDFTSLVITGPNTGGKTVALKTIGLLSLMTQAGLPIPASEKSCLPVFDGVFVDIGDEQSIEQTLSTFSWHIGNIIHIVDRATDRSLVLLDELGTSTDPAQGSALAQAILRHFKVKGTMAVATTHYSDLKIFAHATPGLQNASLDFDPVTLEPTYHLTVGIPGGSNALETAARLGLSPDIIEDARAMLSQGTEELEALLADLMREKEQAESLHHNLEMEMYGAEQKSTELESQLRRLQAQEHKVIQEARDQVVREAAELQREIRQAASQLRKDRTKETLEQGRRTLAAIRRQLKSENWQPKVSEGVEEESTTPISPGDTVWLKEANIPATVLSVSAKTRQIEVQAGSTRIKLKIDGVAQVKVPTGKDRERSVPTIITEKSRTVPMELHLRGKRAEEVEWLLNSYLDNASLAGLYEVRIVHGSGTGVLRNIVRELLPHHPLVKSFRPGGRGEGGNGVTIAQL